MTSGSNCLHLNRPETDDARSIGPAYQTTPAKLQHCLSGPQPANCLALTHTSTRQWGIQLLIPGRGRHRHDKHLVCIGISDGCPGRISLDVDFFTWYKRAVDQAVLARLGGGDIVGSGNRALRICVRWRWRSVRVGLVGAGSFVVALGHVGRRLLGRSILAPFLPVSVELVPCRRMVVVCSVRGRAVGE